jgi:hypothetical protein
MSNDALSAKMNYDINSVKDRGLQRLSLWIPWSLSRITRGAANEADDGVACGREKRTERGSDKSGGAAYQDGLTRSVFEARVQTQIVL